MRRFLLIFFFGYFMASLAAGSEILHLATTDWQPYLSPDEKHQGICVEVVRQAFAQQGIKIEADFFPWSRALRIVKDNSVYVGVIGAYKTPQRKQNYLFSDPVCTSHVGIAERADAPIRWNKLDDLSKLNMGVVQDYSNTVELDLRLANGLQKHEVTRTNETNLLKLLMGRVDIVVIDPLVFEYIKNTNSIFKGNENKVQMNSKIFESRPVYVIFRKDKEGEKYRNLLNRGLHKINKQKIAGVIQRQI